MDFMRRLGIGLLSLLILWVFTTQVNVQLITGTSTADNAFTFLVPLALGVAIIVFIVGAKLFRKPPPE